MKQVVQITSHWRKDFFVAATFKGLGVLSFQTA